ncbi:hypothetical protein IWQ57_002027 [Coemansia nantahalensis]|uniref:Uncharacterized protein n=1 Tax=Coemansia nantahalensis TaxID=2789366 RepID=A0ACC1K2D2_9FUNG|nr:hypothetical protein IWQ57_002027 [Coemansia nantahalensis]
MSGKPIVRSVHSDDEPLLESPATFRGRLRARWHRADRTARVVSVLFALMMCAVVVVRVAMEAMSPRDGWPGPPTTIPPDAEEGVKDDSARRDAVRDAMRHAWSGYRQHAFGKDELLPVSNSSNTKWGGWGVTLIDSLDTLHIMGLNEEFREAVTHVVGVDFKKAKAGYTTPFFEMIIRSLGGLLSAYEMSLDRRLLDKAREVGDALLPAFKTETGIPYPRVDVNTGKAVPADRVCIAEAGTVQLEYWKLSELTGNPVYHNTAQRVVDILDTASKPYKGLYPIWIDIRSGKLVSGQITFGGMGDSWYEYMLKQYIYSRRSEDQYRRMYEESIDGMRDKMVRHSVYDPGMYYVGDLDSTATKFSPRFQHLTCFVPGMLALGSRVLDRPDDLELAKQLTYTCFQMYNRTSTRLSPEYVQFRDASDKGIAPSQENTTDFEIVSLAAAKSKEREDGFYLGPNRSYILRPETVESLMILYRITGDATYKDWGWQIFCAIERWTKTPAAYSAYGDVMSTDGGSQLTDSMESFFLAETLKYLYLLFSPADYYSLDEYVFNTEAHPFKIMRTPPP